MSLTFELDQNNKLFIICRYNDKLYKSIVSFSFDELIGLSKVKMYTIGSLYVMSKSGTFIPLYQQKNDTLEKKETDVIATTVDVAPSETTKEAQIEVKKPETTSENKPEITQKNVFSTPKLMKYGDKYRILVLCNEKKYVSVHHDNTKVMKFYLDNYIEVKLVGDKVNVCCSYFNIECEQVTIDDIEELNINDNENIINILNNLIDNDDLIKCLTSLLSDWGITHEQFAKYCIYIEHYRYYQICAGSLLKKLSDDLSWRRITAIDLKHYPVNNKCIKALISAHGTHFLTNYDNIQSPVFWTIMNELFLIVEKAKVFGYDNYEDSVTEIISELLKEYSSYEVNTPELINIIKGLLCLEDKNFEVISVTC